jgi:hypothetical protein
MIIDNIPENFSSNLDPTGRNLYKTMSFDYRKLKWHWVKACVYKKVLRLK